MLSAHARQLKQRAFLAVRVGEIEYAIPVECVRAVARPQPILATPEPPAHALGVVHARGRVMHVFSLRSRFGLQPANFREFFVHVEVAGAALIFIVDDVKGVFRATRDQDLELPSDNDADPILFAIEHERGLVFALDVEPFAAASNARPAQAQIG
jgi:purine-binding chemotaxis protein CheW